MNNERIEQNWNQMAEAYERFTDGEDSYSARIEWPCVRPLLPSVQGKRVLDLGCGTGHFTFLLETLGPAALVGVDLSQAMLDIAAHKAREAHSIARFVHGDACAYQPGPPFDLVFSSTLTHYIPCLEPFFTHLYDLLAESGACVLSVMHPVYSAQYPARHEDGSFPGDEEWSVRYLDRRERAYIQPWIEYNDQVDDFLSESYHHTFADYVNAATAAGFALTRAEEPAPPAEWEQKYPERYQAFIETPSFLVMRLDKRGIAASL